MPTVIRRWVILSSLSLALAAHAGDDTAKAQPDAHEADLGPGAKLKFSVGHHFSRIDAKNRIQQLIDYLSGRFGVKSQWAGDSVVLSGTVMGVHFKARLEVKDRAVGGETTDPGLLMRASASNYIRKKLRKYLHPAYRES